MCGIVGWINIGSPALYRAALDRLHHRGPDQEGFWQNEQSFLGMRRLSIIDLATGEQPIWNESGTCCIIYNGELYNFLDLRPELQGRGHIFKTKSDTEVVLHAYEEWGSDCLRRLNGMFAFAIWDSTRKALFLARDRIGEKPLYYYQDGARIAFASEIKALLTDATIPRDVNAQGLVNFLTFGHGLGPDTIYTRIEKLMPGHFLIADAEGIRTKQYWDVGDDPPADIPRDPTDEHLASRVLTLLNDSVQRRMLADVPVGAFLSGGLDSSTVVALMVRHTAGRVKTFSLGFDTGGSVYNELPDARRVAEHFDTEHHELIVRDVDLIEVLRTLVYHYDEPLGDPACFPIYLLSRFAREHVKVVLCGDGGDELFGGYRRYGFDQLAVLYQRLPSFVTENWLDRKSVV